MSTRRALAAAVSAVLCLSVGSAHAEAECLISVDEASESTPHIVDKTSDWHGAALGDGSAGFGDVYREGTDMVAGWIARNDAGVLQAHIKLATLSAAQPNSIFYFTWEYAGDDPIRKRRWVAGRLKGYEQSFTYGYLAPSALPQSNYTFATVGQTTGSLIEGSGGRLVIDIPATGSGTDPVQGGAPVSNHNWGAPVPGSLLSLEPSATIVDAPYGPEARFLVGSPEPLPSAAPTRHGYVYRVDGPDNALQLCDATA